ncbi:hypothetical protein K8T06_00300 [bacterium]|nr:hypothetical protein [bacterium]
MIRRLKYCLLAIILLLPFINQCAEATEYLPLVEVKAGMKCHGFSCFSGIELERLEVEIIGVLTGGDRYNAMILGRVDSPSVRRGGIMSGMSGSPVYFGDKLIGAIASAFPYAKEPICGITPIESMTRLWNLEKAPGRYLKKIPRRDIFSRPGPDMADQLLPIGLAINTRGFTAGPTNVDVSENTSLAPSGFDLSTEFSDVRPGSPVGVGLITGDLEIVAFGTLTHITDSKILAFGHQFFGLGKCNLPLLAAKIVSFIPNQIVSFKLANAGPPIGSLTFDANPGIAGILDRFAPTIPVEISIEGLTTPEPETYSIRAVDQEFLSSIYISQAVTGAINKLGIPWGDLCLETDLEIRLNEGSIVRRHDFSGSVNNLSQIIRDRFQLLEQIHQNPLKPVVIESISIHCVLSQEPRLITLGSVRVPRVEYTAGDTMTVIMTFHGDRIGEFTQSFQLSLPENLPAGKYELYVLDSDNYAKLELMKRLPAHRCASFQTWIEGLNDYLSGDQILITLASDSRDIRTGRFILPDVPPSLQEVMNKNRTGSSLVKSHRFIVSEKINFEFQVFGSAKIPIQIGTGSESES